MSKDTGLEIAPGIFWVSRREDSLLERNIYLRVFEGEGRRINLLVDPGAPRDRKVLDENLSEIIGGMSRLNVAFANHQDPDVAFNLGFLQQLNPELFVLTSEDTWRLLQFYGLKDDYYRSTESFPGGRARMKTGQELQFVPSPYCHFRGAVMLYDKESRVLFTGDLFGGLSFIPDLQADERHWEGVKTFHQIYMPTRESIALALDNIRKLDPPPKMLAPQHGSLITGEWIEFYMEKLSRLPVGLNLLLDSRTKENYLAAVNAVFLELNRTLGPEEFARAVKHLRNDGSFTNIIQFGPSGVVDIKTDLNTGLELLTNELFDHLPGKKDEVRRVMTRVLLAREIPLPERLQHKAAAREGLFEM